MVRHRFLGFGSYVEPVQTRSVFFLDLSEFLRRPQYLYYVEANQSGSSPESLERENTFCTITFQKCKKIKKKFGKYTGSMRSIKKCTKIEPISNYWVHCFFPKKVPASGPVASYKERFKCRGRRNLPHSR